jgi:hypothetical protein
MILNVLMPTAQILLLLLPIYAVTLRAQINNRMKPVQYNGRNYTAFWAWYPVSSSQGQRLWMSRYYIRPGPNGEGIVLSHWEMLLDSQ